MNEEQPRSQSRRRRFYDEEFKRNAVELFGSLSHLGPGTQQRYEMIKTLHGGPDSYSRSELCRALGVSRSGLYDHAAKARRPRWLHDKQLAKEIALLFSQSRCTYGARRLQQMLRRKAIRCGRNRLARLMSGLGLQAVQKRRFRPKTTHSAHDEPVAPNRLNQLPEPPKAPNQVWCADLTYLPSQQEGWLYLAAELDLGSKRIAGWKLSSSLATPLVQEAFERAVKLWSVCPALHHSERGVQYASSAFRELLNSLPGHPQYEQEGLLL